MKSSLYITISALNNRRSYPIKVWSRKATSSYGKETQLLSSLKYRKINLMDMYTFKSPILAFCTVLPIITGIVIPISTYTVQYLKLAKLAIAN